MPVALYTFGQFLRHADDPANDGFYELNDPIFDLVDQAPGLIARSGYASDPGPKPWGEEVYPSFWKDRGEGWSPATLSLWQDLQSPYAFTYSGLHAKALSRGREWFEEPRWPPLVLWWHQSGGRPTWSEGVARHAYLHENGPTPYAFSFKTVFDENGQSTRLKKGTSA